MKKVFLDKGEIGKWNDLMQTDNVNLEDEGLSPNDSLCIARIQLDGGHAELIVNTETSAVWCEMVWYNDNGDEITRSEMNQIIDGQWCSGLDDHDVEDDWSVEIVAK